MRKWIFVRNGRAFSSQLQRRANESNETRWLHNIMLKKLDYRLVHARPVSNWVQLTRLTFVPSAIQQTRRFIHWYAAGAKAVCNVGPYLARL